MKNETSLGFSLDESKLKQEAPIEQTETHVLPVWVEGDSAKKMILEEMDNASNYGVAFVTTVANHWWVLEEDLMRFMRNNGRYVQGVEVLWFDEDRDELIAEMEAR